MSPKDHLGSPADETVPPDSARASAGTAGRDGQPPSRRAVLRTAAGAGAATVAVTAMAGLGGSGPVAGARAGAIAADSRDASDQFVVHVRDARTGQMDVFRGTRQVRLQDRDLARLLDRVSRG